MKKINEFTEKNVLSASLEFFPLPTQKKKINKRQLFANVGLRGKKTNPVEETIDNMPFGIKPICISCKVTSSTLWRKNAQGEILCNSCGLKQTTNGGKETVQNGQTASKNGNGNSAAGHLNHHNASGPVLRKSARIKPTKSRIQAATKALATKGKSRRIIFKKSVSTNST